MSQFIYGRNPVLEWLAAELPPKKILIARDLKSPAVQEIVQLATQKKIPLQRFDRQAMDKLVGHPHHQGVVAEVDTSAYAEINDILAIAEQRQEPPLIGILDDIQDPHNLGAILRSAEGAAMHGIIIPKDKAVGLTPVVFKASAGAAALVPVAQVTNLARSMEELKEAGLWFVGTDDSAQESFMSSDFKGPTGIVLGSEGKGMRRLIREKCDFLVRIPMYGKINSLNVSIAAALMFFEARRQRGE
jgi:23S rRNA (guanosine2251-2'-O)-methyltransferase